MQILEELEIRPLFYVIRKFPIQGYLAYFYWLFTALSVICPVLAVYIMLISAYFVTTTFVKQERSIALTLLQRFLPAHAYAAFCRFFPDLLGRYVDIEILRITSGWAQNISCGMQRWNWHYVCQELDFVEYFVYGPVGWTYWMVGPRQVVYEIVVES